MYTEEDEPKEPWKESVDYPDKRDIWASFAPPGSFQEQRLRLDEIDTLVNRGVYGRAKSYLDEMIPDQDLNRAEHSFQLARCYGKSRNKKIVSLETALLEIDFAISIDPSQERFQEYRSELLNDIKNRKDDNQIRKRGIALLTTVSIVVASSLGFAVYQLLS